MADDLHYKPGEFYRICDRTGFKIRAPRTEQEWNGLIVRDRSWEKRQPQDFVRGVPDQQQAEDPRPRQTDTNIGADVISMAQSAASNSNVIFLSNGLGITISTRLPYSAGAGNVVVDLSATSTPDSDFFRQMRVGDSISIILDNGVTFFTTVRLLTPAPTDPWILASGFWSDAGVWVDAAVWID